VPADWASRFSHDDELVEETVPMQQKMSHLLVIPSLFYSFSVLSF